MILILESVKPALISLFSAAAGRQRLGSVDAKDERRHRAHKQRRGIHSAKGRFAHDTLALAWRRGGTTAGTGQALAHKAATHQPTTWPHSPQQTMQAR